MGFAKVKEHDTNVQMIRSLNDRRARDELFKRQERQAARQVCDVSLESIIKSIRYWIISSQNHRNCSMIGKRGALCEKRGTASCERSELNAKRHCDGCSTWYGAPHQ